MKIKFLLIFIFASFLSITHADDHVEIGEASALPPTAVPQNTTAAVLPQNLTRHPSVPRPEH